MSGAPLHLWPALQKSCKVNMLHVRLSALQVKNTLIRICHPPLLLVKESETSVHVSVHLITCLDLFACSQRRASVLQWNPEIATQLIVASDDDRTPTLQMWDLRNSVSPLKEFVGHTKVRRMLFSADAL